MLAQKQLPGFNSVPASLASGATSVVTCKLPLNLRAHVYWLVFGNDGATNPGQGLGTLAAPGMINEIRVLIDGTPQRRITATELNAINASNGSSFAAKTSGTAAAAGFRTYLPIWLAEPWRKGFITLTQAVTLPSGIVIPAGTAIPEAELSAWNLPDGTTDQFSETGIKTATIEVDLIGRTSAGANAVLDGPVIGGFYEFDDLTSPALGSIVKFYRKSFGPTASPAEITDLSKTNGSYQSIHLFPTSGNNYVTSLLFTRNNNLVRQDITRFQNDASLLGRQMTPTALDTTSNTTKQNTGLYNLVFDYDDPIRNLLAVGGVSELTMKPTYDSAPSGQQDLILQVTGPAD